MRTYDYQEFREHVNALTRNERIPKRDKPVGIRNPQEEDLLRANLQERVWDMFSDGTLTKIGERTYQWKPHVERE